jgi:hypothetical protein
MIGCKKKIPYGLQPKQVARIKWKIELVCNLKNMRFATKLQPKILVASLILLSWQPTCNW